MVKTMNNEINNEWENTPEFQELRLCKEREKEISKMIDSLRISEERRLKEEENLTLNLIEACQDRGHFFDEELLVEIDDGIGREEYEGWESDERDDDCCSFGGPAGLTGEWVTKTRDYQRRKMVFRKKCKCCGTLSQRDATKEIKIEYK